MSLKIAAVLETAERMLRTDAFSTAAKNGQAKTTSDRAILSRAEQQTFARYSMTYASADRVRDARKADGARGTAPAALVYQTAQAAMSEAVGDVDRNARVTLDWLDELSYNAGDVGGLLHLAVARSSGDPISFEQRLDSLRTFFADSDIEMGGGVRVGTGSLSRGTGARAEVRRLLDASIADAEQRYGEHIEAGQFKTTPVAGIANGIKAAGLSIAADAFGEAGPESALTYSTQVESLIERMGPGVRHVSARARVVGESLQGDTPVFAQVHMFYRPDGSYVTFSTLGGQASRPWEK